MMREIVLDTETTGLDPSDGHRIIEIGCVELVDHLPSGRVFHSYLNPEREVPLESERVHGITTGFLEDKPLFNAVVEEFLAFIADDPLVIHNASFDMNFLNAEFRRIDLKPLPLVRAIDTIALAKEKIPGARYSLDELCKRFGIDLSSRSKHGALVDAELTAKVYLELLGGRQRNLLLGENEAQDMARAPRAARQRPYRLESLVDDAERAAHEAFVTGELGDSPLWSRLAD